MRRVTPLQWLTAAVFAAAVLSRSVWLRSSFFHPDASTVLWMALDAVRDPALPDHGLISSLSVFQPPGLVWAALPWVVLGGGRPEVVIVGFALVNAAAIALLVATVGRAWGLLYATVLGAFLVAGPDAFFSAWIWHPSLYSAAVALLLAAGIRLRSGSLWWAAVLVALPGLSSLVHYSGLLLAVPALVLLLVARRSRRALLAPAAVGAVVVVCMWIPFLAFEADRGWVDVETSAGVTEGSGSAGGKLRERATDLRLAVTHLAKVPHHGRTPLEAAHLRIVLWTLVAAAIVLALARGRWRDPGFALPAAVLASGVGAQVALAQGDRADVVLLWLVPAYALAAWAVVQLAELARGRVPRAAVAGAAAAIVLAVGVVDLARFVDAMPHEDRLSVKWDAARAGSPVDYPAAADPETSANRHYLPCDPPYDWGSEIWYLREVLDEGRGLAEAEAAGAFRAREGVPCHARRVG